MGNNSVKRCAERKTKRGRERERKEGNEEEEEEEFLLHCHFISFLLDSRAKMSWAGDWMCGACQHMNFKKRELCQRCGFSKYGDHDQAAAMVSTYAYNTGNNNNNRAEEVLAGDWYCQAFNCVAHNYASRTTCFRCHAQKPDIYTNSVINGDDTMMSCAGHGSEVALPGWKSGDWICTRPGCGLHNYACRTECYQCKMPRDYGGMH
uniref:RanBP2-type domain-containing protein n=1 Tax=Opuntia streptacantha TaxID=393608 RepID=A0A7C9CXD1_OPUST